jgi:ribose 5-phosphate isomerase A
MNLKEQAALRAVEFVKDGMTVGLGTGSTSAYAIREIGRRLASGELKDVQGIPTSEGAAQAARELGIPLVELTRDTVIHVAIDGADEVDPDFNLTKGLGGALLREKIVEGLARSFIVIVDDSKIVTKLGTRSPIPVEILRFGADVHMAWLESLGCRPEYRRADDGEVYVTDNANYLADCHFADGVPDVFEFTHTLSQRPGVVEHGIFMDMTSALVVASEQGVDVVER